MPAKKPSKRLGDRRIKQTGTIKHSKFKKRYIIMDRKYFEKLANPKPEMAFVQRKTINSEEKIGFEDRRESKKTRSFDHEALGIRRGKTPRRRTYYTQ